MNAAFKFASLALIPWAANAAAEPADCPAGPAEVVFSTPVPPPAYVYDKSVNAIQFMMRERGHVFAGLDDTWILGVTVAEPVMTLSGDIEETPVDDGICTRLAKVRASFGYERVEVYIGSDFKPGTCAFKATSDHEYQHVTINTYTLEEFAKPLKAKLEALAAAERGRLRADGDAADEPLLKPYRTVLDAAVRDFRQVQASRNAALDTPQSYARTQALCTDWNQSYTWTKTTPVQRAPAQAMPRDRANQRKPAQRAPAEIGRMGR